MTKKLRIYWKIKHEIHWRKSAIISLLNLDKWRRTVELPPISQFLKDSIDTYFNLHNFSIYTPGRQVIIKNMPVDLKMTLLSIGKSDPYTVFYRITSQYIEIF